MLPFLAKPRSQTGVTTELRKPDKEQPAEDHSMMACAQDIIDAIHAGDRKRLAATLRSMFEILESEPHQEGPHIEDQE